MELFFFEMTSKSFVGSGIGFNKYNLSLDEAFLIANNNFYKSLDVAIRIHEEEKPGIIKKFESKAFRKTFRNLLYFKEIDFQELYDNISINEFLSYFNEQYLSLIKRVKDEGKEVKELMKSGFKKLLNKPSWKILGKSPYFKECFKSFYKNTKIRDIGKEYKIIFSALDYKHSYLKKLEYKMSKKVKSKGFREELSKDISKNKGKLRIINTYAKLSRIAYNSIFTILNLFLIKSLGKDCSVDYVNNLFIISDAEIQKEGLFI
jgi:hypothetical protein